MPENKIIIDKAVKLHCTACRTVLRMSNETETLFCNSLILYFNNENPSQAIAKCRECKTMNTIELGDYK